MDKATLEGRRADVEARYNQIQSSKAELSEKLMSQNQELLRLEGDFRTLTDLIENFKEVDKNATNQPTKRSDSNISTRK